MQMIIDLITKPVTVAQVAEAVKTLPANKLTSLAGVIAGLQLAESIEMPNT